MKKVIHMLCGFFMAAVLFTSCQKNCDEWHEGKKCETELREKYVGTYQGVKMVNSNTNNFTTPQSLLLSASSQGVQYLIENDEFVFELNTDGSSFTVPPQTWYNANLDKTYDATGSGSFPSADSIRYVIHLTDSGAFFATFTFAGHK